jgi:hypothetical protein
MMIANVRAPRPPVQPKSRWNDRDPYAHWRGATAARWLCRGRGVQYRNPLRKLKQTDRRAWRRETGRRVARDGK